MTPEEITERIGLYFQLVRGVITEADALRFFEGEFWGDFVRRGGYVDIKSRRWKGVLCEHRKGHLLKRIFGYRRPESIKRWIHRFYLLFDGMTERQAVDFMSRNLWSRKYPVSHAKQRVPSKHKNRPARHLQVYAPR